MTHGSYTSYVKQSCRCASCTRSMREYEAEWTRNRNRTPSPIGTARLTIPNVEESRGSTGNLPGKQIFATAIRVWCQCGNSGYANPWIVGKVRRIDSCEACR